MSQLKALDEIHQIMEKIYKSQRGMTKEEIAKDFRGSSERFMKEHNLRLRRSEKRIKVS